MASIRQYSDSDEAFRDFFARRGVDVDVDAQAVVVNLFLAQAEVFSSIEGLVLRPLGLTHAGFVILMSLWTQGELETRQLARIQGVSKPAIVSAVDTLERAGLVRRTRSEVDRRLVSIEITRHGLKLVEEAQVRTHACELDITHVLARDEQQSLARLLRKLAGSARATVGVAEEAAAG